MAKGPRPIGEILVELGFITPANVDQALAHQRERGGKLGDALVEMGVVTRSEVEWGLADQYDLPMVQLQAESIDRALAARVPRAWARANLMLPVLRSGDTVTAVVCDPRDVERLHEISRFTGAERVEAALTSAENLRALIDAVHPPLESVALGDWFAELAGRGVRELGISVRGLEATGWTGDDPAARQPFAAGWPLELMGLLTPGAPRAEPGRGALAQWSALADFGRERWLTTCSRVSSSDAAEWTIRLADAVPGGRAGVAAEPRLVTAVRAAIEHGSASMAVEIDRPAAIQAVLLAGLPASVLGPDCRAAHLASTPTPLPTGTLALSREDLGPEGIAGLGQFHFDALTFDAPDTASLRHALRAARLVVFPASGPEAAVRARLSDSPEGFLWTLAEVDRGTD